MSNRAGLLLCPETEVEYMPRRPRRGCAWNGCPKLAAEGSQYCEEHRTEAARQYNRYERSPEVKKKYGRAWQRIRSRYARSHPLCEQCFKEGRLTPVEEVHHIIPVAKGGTHDFSNLMSLCRSCHTKIHMETGDRQIRR